MTWKKHLTEDILHECWHEGSSLLNAGYHCRKCDKAFSVNRTFTTRSDLMDLYQKVYEDGKWGSFSIFSLRKFRIDRESDYYNSWRCCLNGEGYEERCKAVAEFYGWEEEK